MANPTQATLEYFVLPTNVSQAVMESAMSQGAVPLYSSPTDDPVLKGLFDCTVTSDTIAVSGSNVTRTIVLALGAGFFTLFPTSASWSGAFNDLYTHTLAHALCANVGADAVVFA